LLGQENLPPLEALAIGCPVIAAGIPGAKEQLGDAALFFSPLDENELARTILKLKESASIRSDLIQRGRDRARRFTSDEIAVKTFEILDRFAAIRRCWDNDYHYQNRITVRRLFGK
jgi:glycosyltransferase involved in cell wall biosynthesis